MTAALTITGIDRIIAEPLDGPGWVVRFRSTHTGLHHQSYVNGRLADWTDFPRQRHFFVAAPSEAAEVLIAAVEARHRTTDLSDQLPVEDRNPAWVFRPRIVRSIAARPGDVLEVIGDHATGELSDAPLAAAEIWPAWARRWAFGEDRFGEGAFGYDGALATGMGSGAFGAGAFGMDADLIGVEVALAEAGTHQIVLRTRALDGQMTDADPVYVCSAAPPIPPAAITAVNYDPQTQQLTLQID